MRSTNRLPPPTTNARVPHPSQLHCDGWNAEAPLPALAVAANRCLPTSIFLKHQLYETSHFEIPMLLEISFVRA